MILIDSNKFWTEQNKASRYYCRRVNGEVVKYPSVTTVMSTGEKRNSGSSPSMSIGTIVHYHILRRYSKYPLKKPTEQIWNINRNEVIGRVRRCLDMWENLDLDIKPICVETAIFNETPLYAGRLDMLAKIDNVITLIDIKTGKQYSDHIIQAAGYWNALRKRPKVCFIYLDGILDRNPEQKAIVHYFEKQELEEGYEEFLNKYVEL